MVYPRDKRKNGIRQAAKPATALRLADDHQVAPADARVVRITNTLNLSRICVSESVLRDPANQAKLEALSPMRAIGFDAQEYLLDPQ